MTWGLGIVIVSCVLLIGAAVCLCCLLVCDARVQVATADTRNALHEERMKALIEESKATIAAVEQQMQQFGAMNRKVDAMDGRVVALEYNRGRS
jgi:TolA-binding protein